MRKLLKFLHTVATVGFTGALAVLIVLYGLLPEPVELERYATLRLAMDAVARWLLLPSMALVLVSGLLAVVVTPRFQNAGWMWAKLLSGILVFEGTLVSVQAPVERAAREARAALDGTFDVAALGVTPGSERGAFLVILAVALANVALGVWRPRWRRKDA